MSDANRVSVAIARSAQESFPVTGAVTLKKLRFTETPSLAFAPQSIVSAEIRPDRQVSDLIPVGAEAGGGTNTELSYENTDEIIESAAFGTWDNTAESVVVDFPAADQIEVTAGQGDRFQVGSIVRLVGDALTTGTPGDGVYVVSSILVDVLTVAAYDANTNAIAGTEVPAAATSLKITGYQAEAAGELIFSSAASGSGQTVTITASGASAFDNLRNAEAGSLSNLVAGHWIKVAGFTVDTENKNVQARILSITSTTITFAQDNVADFSTGQDGTGLQISLFFGDVLINPDENNQAARVDRQFIVERSFTDHNPITREVFLGMLPNEVAFRLEPQAIAVTNITWFGITASIDDDTGITNLYAAGAPARDDAPTFDVYNTSSNVGRIGRGDDKVGEGGVNCVLLASVEINNNLAYRPAVGVFGSCGIRIGEYNVAGDLNTYFDDKTLYVDLLQGNETSFDFSVSGNDGRALLVDCPRVKFQEGAPDGITKNSDAVLPLRYQALADQTLGYTTLFERFPYYA